MANPVEDAKNRLVEGAAKDMARRALDEFALSPEEKAQKEKQRAAASRKRNIKIVLGLTAVAVVGIGIMTLLAKLWFYAIAAVVVGGVGFAGYLTVRPRVLELRAARAQKQLAANAAAQAREQERQAQQAQKDAEAAREAKQRALEEQLEALKKKV